MLPLFIWLFTLITKFSVLIKTIEGHKIFFEEKNEIN